MAAGTGGWAAALAGEPAVLVTGAAGFIGMHVAAALLDAGVAVVGFDNVNPYYDVRLKRARLAELARRPGFRFVEGDLADRAALRAAVDAAAPRRVVHLAAQAGVRWSIENPHAYAESNLTGFLNVLEECRRIGPAHLLYASSSSVYGGNARTPFSAAAGADHPVSLYAATKRANEMMAHAYCHLYGFPATGLRFFTVYGPWGRPDMACWRFAEAIETGQPLQLYNEGRVSRDFTYVDDVVESVLRLLVLPAAPDPGFDRAAPRPNRSWAAHQVYNIGAADPLPVQALIAALEAALGRRAEVTLLPAQPGDVEATAADVADLEAATGFRPGMRIDEGVRRFVVWWRGWRGRPATNRDAAPTS